jgi:hypothetical protein
LSSSRQDRRFDTYTHREREIEIYAFFHHFPLVFAGQAKAAKEREEGLGGFFFIFSPFPPPPRVAVRFFPLCFFYSFVFSPSTYTMSRDMLGSMQMLAESMARQERAAALHQAGDPTILAFDDLFEGFSAHLIARCLIHAQRLGNGQSRPVISIGSGSGALEQELASLGVQHLVCCDPAPNEWQRPSTSKYATRGMQPMYATAADLIHHRPDIVGQGVKLARARKRYSFFRRAKALLALRALPPHQMKYRLRKA